MWKSRRTADDEFAVFVAESQSSLSKTAWLLTGHREAAADLLQQALVKTYTAWSRVRRDDAAAYCRKVMANQAIDDHRRRREIPVDGAPDRASQRDAYRTVDDRDELVRLLAQLPPQQRTIIVLRYFDDLTEQAVADELNLSLGTVKSAASRGLATLRSLREARGTSSTPRVAPATSTPHSPQSPRLHEGVTS